jgi:hypothetical protein
MVLKIRPQSDSVFFNLEPVVLTRQNREPTTVYINPTNPKFNIAISYQGSRLHTILQFHMELVWVSYLDISHVVS